MEKQKAANIPPQSQRPGISLEALFEKVDKAMIAVDSEEKSDLDRKWNREDCYDRVICRNRREDVEY